jgi:hypothetical protein
MTEFTIRRIKQPKFSRLTPGICGYRVLKDGKFFDSFTKKSSIKKCHPGIKFKSA